MKIVVLNNQESANPVTTAQVIERLNAVKVECEPFDRCNITANHFGGEVHCDDSGETVVFNFTGTPNESLDFDAILAAA